MYCINSSPFQETRVIALAHAHTHVKALRRAKNRKVRLNSYHYEKNNLNVIDTLNYSQSFLR